MELGGLWFASPSDDDLRRSLAAADVNTDGWAMVDVPGHWCTSSELADADGPVAHLRRFELEHGDDGTRWWLELDGVFSQSDVYLDGDYLGDTEGYFVRHAFEVTEQVAARREHQLVVEVACHPTGSLGPHRDVLGAFEGGSDMWPRGNPGGIWRPVRVSTTGAVRIGVLRAVCREATADQARIHCRAVLDSTAPRSVRVRSVVAGVEQVSEQPLAAGRNEIEWSVTVPEPDLWWPAGLGPADLTDLAVEVETRADEISHRVVRRLGLRSVELKRNSFGINGERLFLKGCNLAPAGPRPAVGDGRALEDIAEAAAAGANLVRPYAHVAPDAFYAAADEQGMLVWQDLPLLGRAANTVRKQAARDAVAMVDQLAHHPSIIAWCAHVAPAGSWMKSGRRGVADRLATFAGHELPTFAKSVLDRSVKRVFNSNDGSRPAFGYTGVLPHPPRLDTAPTHLWLGWRGGSERDLPAVAARLPSRVGLVSELGAQSAPTDPPFIDPSIWPRLDEDRLRTHHGMEVEAFRRYVPPVGHPDLTSWIDATQLYQSVVIRRQVEELRRLKHRPTGGVFVHYLRDAQPVVGASVIDSEGRRKRGFEALRAAFAPVIVVADRLPREVRGGERVRLRIHVVSDLRETVPDAEVEAVLEWPGGRRAWRFGGPIPPDSCVQVGRIDWTAPMGTGPVLLRLHLETATHDARNRYDATLR